MLRLGTFTVFFFWLVGSTWVACYTSLPVARSPPLESFPRAVSMGKSRESGGSVLFLCKVWLGFCGAHKL